MPPHHHLATGERPRARARALLAAMAMTTTVLVLAACSGDDPATTGDAADGSVQADPERSLRFDGPDGDLLNADELATTAFEVTATGDDAHLEDIRLQLTPAADPGAATGRTAPAGETTLRLEPGELADGDYTVTVLRFPEGVDPDLDAARSPDEDRGDTESAEGDTESTEGDAEAASGSGENDTPDAEVLRTWEFTVDATPPSLDVTPPSGGVVDGEALTISGSSEPEATVEVADSSVTVADDGSFEVELATAESGTLTVVATDPAGNTSATELDLVTVPSRATVDDLRAVHVSFCAWASPSLKDPVMAAIDAGRINAVQLDLKDETGKIGFTTENDFAAQIGSDDPDCRIDLQAAVAQLHALGVPVIGRIVAFADPVLAPWAWANDQPDLAIQEADGSAIYTGRYAGFANFAHPDVQAYNLDIAEEAAAMGVDHILWDYLRKPDGSIDNMRVPGLDGSVEDAIVDFTRAADERLAPYGIQHGASLYGVSADRPGDVGQDVERLAEVLDYVSPMIYPSHWGPGEYGVDDPLMQPYDIITETLAVWQEATAGKRARVAPWLEDSNWPLRLGYPDRADYVRQQIQATYDAGLDEWLLWDSSVRYTDQAMLAPPEREPADGSGDEPTDDAGGAADGDDDPDAAGDAGDAGADDDG